jgi:putative ABC transport system permease protein
VAVVLLICCVNLANLYLAQGASRRREFAIRAALGAGRSRVARQLLSESLMLALTGGAAGTLIAIWVVDLIRVRAPQGVPRVEELGVDLRVLAFAAGLSMLTAVLFAVVAARRAGSPHLADALSERAGTATTRGGYGRLPSWLVSAQVALTVVLLAGATLLVRSFWRLSRVDPGFEPQELVAVTIIPPSPTYDDPGPVIQLYDRLMESVRAVPGVARVAMVNHAPFSGGALPTRAALGQVPTGSTDDISVLFRTVTPGYFATLGASVVLGREFTEADARGPAGPVMVNQALARAWGGRSPVGERLGVLKAARTRADFGQPVLGTVVGVAGEMKHFSLAADTSAVVYVPYTHNPWASMTLLARTSRSPESLIAPVEASIRETDPAIPLEPAAFGLGATTMDDRVRGSYAPQRFNALLLGGFAAAALLLASIGIYGVVSYGVTLETREIGIRLALGARASGVLREVVGRIALIALAGLVAGIIAALALTRFMTSLLFEIRPTDFTAYLGPAALLLVVAGVAAYLPARRAARVDPASALRS